MAEIIEIKQYLKLFLDIKKSIEYFNENLFNDFFQQKENESNEKAYKRGEGIFDQFDSNGNNLDIILQKENEILEFFKICKENKEKINEHKNEIINQLLTIKKNNPTVSKEEYNKCKEEWNKRRIETPDVRNRRECEEMLEEIKEEKRKLEELEKIIEQKNDPEFIKMIMNLTKEGNELTSQNIFDKLKEEYVKKNEIPYVLEKEKKCINFNLTPNEMKQLEQWTELKCTEIVFDSNVDKWSENDSDFDTKIMNQKQLVFLIEDKDGEKFGYYLNTEVIEDYYWEYGDQPIKTDKKSFEFNLESNGRLPHPMKFEIKDLQKGGYYLYEKSENHFISLGNIYLYKENNKNSSCCYQFEHEFDYHGIENALCGKIYPYRFTPKRILVIQMK